jgi:hypothetical protein
MSPDLCDPRREADAMTDPDRALTALACPQPTLQASLASTASAAH